MKTRIIRYLNRDGFIPSDWIIEVKSEKDKKYHPLFNGDRPYTFKEREEAEAYLDSVKHDIEELVRTEPR